MAVPYILGMVQVSDICSILTLFFLIIILCTVVRFFPASTLSSSIAKSLLGQIIFGPLFILVFFTSALLQSNTFSAQNFVSKVKSDFYGTWAAGLGFWPLMDFISYTFFPLRFIPLFMNVCSFVWTVYLSLMSNR